MKKNNPEKVEVWEKYFSENYPEIRYYFINKGSLGQIVGLGKTNYSLGEECPSSSSGNCKKLDIHKVIKLKLQGIIK